MNVAIHIYELFDPNRMVSVNLIKLLFINEGNIKFRWKYF